MSDKPTDLGYRIQMNYLLIINCSQRKVLRPQPVYAMFGYDGPTAYRYDGPAYRTLRELNRDGRLPNNLEVLIVSAKYGLLSPRGPIFNYDPKMTAEDADGIRPFVQARLKTIMTFHQYDQVFINLSKTYRRTLDGFHWGTISRLEATGGTGLKTQQMKAWLERITEGKP